MSGDKVEYAKTYRDAGIMVHPLREKEKIPIKPNWSEIKEPMTDQEIIDCFNHKNYNVGAVCGKNSDLVVIDVDYCIPGIWEQVLSGVDTSEWVVQSRTNDRWHWIFRHNNTAKIIHRKPLGFDLLSDGSQVVMCPSVHPSGDVYKISGDVGKRPVMPDEVIKRINNVVKVYDDLNRTLGKGRRTFLNFFNAVFVDEKVNKEPNHHYHRLDYFRNSEGRNRTLYLMSELKANGADDRQLILMCMLMFGSDFDLSQSEVEIRNIDEKKTAKNETIRNDSVLGQFFDERDNAQRDKKRMVGNALSGFKTPALLDIAEDMQKRTPMVYDKSHIFWFWDDDHYVQVDETDIQIAIMEIVDDERKFLGGAKNAIMDAIKMKARMRNVKEKPKSWVHLQNGIVDIFTGEHIVPSPEYMLTDPIPHNLSNSTETPTFDRLFNSWVAPEFVQMLYEICAYCLVDDYPIHRWFMPYGSGRNGKGQFTNILVRLVGRINTTSTTLEGLGAGNRFESARMLNKKLVTVGETDFQTLRDTKLLKMLTGGDPIPAEIKNNKALFNFVNTAKLIVNTNSPPPTNDKTDAFYARCTPIHFYNKFTNCIDIVNNISDQEFDNLVTKCLDIARDLLARGEFTNEGTIDEKRRRYESLSNPIIKFVEDACIRDVNEIMPLWHFEEQFNDYLKSTGQRERTKPELRKELSINGFELKTNHTFKGFTKNGQWTGIIGISLKNNVYKETFEKNNPSKMSKEGERDAAAVRLECLDILDISHSDSYNKELSGNTPNTPNTPNGTPIDVEIKEIKQFIGGHSEQKENRKNREYQKIALGFCMAHKNIYTNVSQVQELIERLANEGVI